MNQFEFRKWLFDNASILELLQLLCWKLTGNKKMEIFIKYHKGCNFYTYMRYAKTN